MSLSSPSEGSLFELIPADAFLSVSATTLQSLVGAFIDLLIQEQLKATVWLKPPEAQNWLEEVQRYQHAIESRQVYWFNHEVERESRLDLPVVPVKLSQNELEQEYFLLVLSPQFGGLILAQVIEDQTADVRFKLAYSFDRATIQGFVTKLGQMAEADTIATSLTESIAISPPFPQGELLAHLLHKQIEQIEATSSVPRLAKAGLADDAETQSKASEQDVEATAVSPTDALHLKQEFLSRLARELLPPLTNMKTALRLLESKQLKREQRQRYIELLGRECDRQNSLISGLLELVQLDAVQEDARLSVRLEELVPGIVSTYQPLANEKGISLGYTVPAELPPIACPSHWLRQILLNLLNNSLKFTSSQGRVFVQAARKEEAVELKISDTGIGIESSDLPKIFHSFYRGRNAQTEEIPGAGLGLTIVQQLLKRCGGSISVSSRIGRGTSFTLILPVARSKK